MDEAELFTHLRGVIVKMIADSHREGSFDTEDQAREWAESLLAEYDEMLLRTPQDLRRLTS